MPKYYTHHHQLFGPLPGSGHVTNHPSHWTTLTAYTANSKEFYFNWPHPHIVWAAWTLVWLPSHMDQRAKLMSRSYPQAELDVPGSELAPPSITGNPIVQSANVTNAFRAMKDQGMQQYIMSYLKGGPAQEPIRIYESRLTILTEDAP